MCRPPTQDELEESEPSLARTFWRLRAVALVACCDEALGRITAPDDPGSDGPAGRIALAVAARRDLLTRAAEAARHAEAGAPLGSPTVVEE